eukprot:TRINITY_DN23588_c0_g1_i1.p1 TRINITY_DN23588_c0_g1~~TRINITY_DN23588_c0_g1_i1.p1  ORF type:complete len:395 (-),score=125.60 TRINITY_DN23588_c0_g1_i1:1207-2391(-)
MAKTEERLVEEYSAQLDALTSSKDSIMKSSKFALENPAFHEQLFLLIVTRLEQTPASSLKKRIPLWYLVDSICQNAKLKQRAEYLALTSRYLPYLVGLLVRQCDTRDREKATTTIKKVLAIWEQRSVLDQTVIKDFVARLDSGEDFSASSLKPSTLKRHSESASTEDKLKAIEDYRRESKRLRWENSLRPANDNEFAQLNELWDKVEPVDLSAKPTGTTGRSPSSSASTPGASSPSVKASPRSPSRTRSGSGSASRPPPSAVEATPDSNIREEAMVESPGSSPVASRRADPARSNGAQAQAQAQAQAVPPAVLPMAQPTAHGQFTPPTAVPYAPAGGLSEPYLYHQQQLLQQQQQQQHQLSQQQQQLQQLQPPSLLPPRSLPSAYGDVSSWELL